MCHQQIVLLKFYAIWSLCISNTNENNNNEKIMTSVFISSHMIVESLIEKIYTTIISE